MFDFSFYKGKRVLITGHTGFKGVWLSRLLLTTGAEVTGYALEPSAAPALFDLCALSHEMRSVTGDIRNLDALRNAFAQSRPEIVIHMAAQPIVRRSYQDPVYTYETNVMGTVNILECVRNSTYMRSFLNVTTDKVYRNKEWIWGYRENEELDGYDPYSNSKSCSELVTRSYKRAYFSGAGSAASVSTARAGNVIGGGDFAEDRIIPDCVRAAVRGREIFIRNPYSTRPYQHVLEPLYAYLMIAARQYENKEFAGDYNVGPDMQDCVQTGDLADKFAVCWGEGLSWGSKYNEGPHEADSLRLDCSKMKAVFGWKPRWNLDKAVEKTVEWTKCWNSGFDTGKCMDRQIQEFLRS